MFIHPDTTASLIECLRHAHSIAHRLISSALNEEFYDNQGNIWSAADYFKHLLLTVKPLVKGLERTPDRLKEMFGESDHPSREYAAVVTAYQKRIAEGIRAEDYEPVTPATFRIPEGKTDDKDYLLEVWDDAHERLFRALELWTEADLDTAQIPHPAFGMITIREMLYFLVYHNLLHIDDMQQTVPLRGE